MKRGGFWMTTVAAGMAVLGLMTVGRAGLKSQAVLFLQGQMKIAAGDNARVAQKVCSELGMTSTGTLTGAEMDAMGDDDLKAAAHTATIFARVSPDQKARLIAALRGRGSLCSSAKAWSTRWKTICR